MLLLKVEELNWQHWLVRWLVNELSRTICEQHHARVAVKPDRYLRVAHVYVTVG